MIWSRSSPTSSKNTTRVGLKWSSLTKADCQFILVIYQIIKATKSIMDIKLKIEFSALKTIKGFIIKFFVKLLYLNSNHDSSMFIDQLLQQILISSVGVVVLCYLSTKLKSLQVWTPLYSLFVSILVFMSNTKLLLCPVSGVGVKLGSLTSTSIMFIVSTIKEMLFRNICKFTSSCFFKAGLN